MGILASSSLSFRFEQATPANIAGVVYKEVFERSERTFYRRKQRYSLPVLPSSPLCSWPKFLIDVFGVGFFTNALPTTYGTRQWYHSATGGRDS